MNTPIEPFCFLKLCYKLILSFTLVAIIYTTLGCIACAILRYVNFIPN